MFKVISLEISGCFELLEGMEDSSDKLNFLYLEGEKKAEVADASERSVKIDRNVFLSIWNSIIHLDFAKIIEENQDNEGCDGYTLTVHIGSLMNELAVSLWCPSESRYAEHGCTESAALMQLVNQLYAIAEEKGFKTGFGAE